jgi:chromosome segregation ATPase
MNDQYETPIIDSVETLKGCLWALGTGVVLVGFVMLMWLGIQRVELASATNHWKAAEIECNLVRTQMSQALQESNQQIAQAQSALADAQNQMQSAVQSKAEAEGRCAQARTAYAQAEQEISYLRSLLAHGRN